MGRGYLHRQPAPENIEQSIQVLGSAVNADPGFALAHAALCEAYWRMGSSGDTRGPERLP